jgi:hypothetical protein
LRFLRALQQSIFDAAFLREAPRRRRREVLWTLTVWLLVATLVSGVAHSFYFVYARNGFPKALARAMAGSVITNGVLTPPCAAPCTPSPVYLQDAASRLLVGMKELAGIVPDSFVVFDTAAGAVETHGPSTVLVMGRDHVTIVARPFVLPLAYADLFGAQGRFAFSEEEVRRFLAQRLWPLAFHFVQWDSFVLTFKLFGAYLLLLLASYILSTGRESLRGAATRSAYALAPMIVGTTMEALAGVDFKEPWYLFMGACMLVLMRGTPPRQPKAAEGDER